MEKIMKKKKEREKGKVVGGRGNCVERERKGSDPSKDGSFLGQLHSELCRGLGQYWDHRKHNKLL